MSSELQCRFTEDTCSIYHSISALHPGSKKFLDQQRISATITHYQANLPDLSTEIHTAKRLLQMEKIGSVGGDKEPVAMDSTLRFLILTEPYRDALYELYRLLVIVCTLPATLAGCECSFSKLNPLTAISRGSGCKFFVTLYHEPVVRIEHYMQNGADSRGPDRTMHANWDHQPAARIYT